MLSDEREIEQLVGGQLSLALAASPTTNIRQVTAEPPWLRVLITGLALLFIGIFLLIPLIAVFTEALREGIHVYLASITHPEARSAIKLTLVTAAIAVPLNLIFGLMAAWAITRFRFRGRSLLTTLIDLPFAVSPVISGMIFVLLFGAQGLAGNWFAAHHLKIVFATPGIVLATTFVTFPFIARELIPVMEAAGVEQELAALTLGANGWQIFFRITLPNVKWGLLYGLVTCNARAMGEFGAVSVVSGHIRGLTNTLPLYVEILYNEYDFAASFAVASLLTLLAVITLILRRLLNRTEGVEHTTEFDSKLRQQEAA
ncbi:MAG TPA: sulfate ABC transporter permease subunit CysW [Candidatus Binataceae bacterium]|nr:sulfate ABC transporter permease subunit CysW [Candidatus Binataceae bacterium]